MEVIVVSLSYHPSAKREAQGVHQQFVARPHELWFLAVDFVIGKRTSQKLAISPFQKTLPCSDFLNSLREQSSRLVELEEHAPKPTRHRHDEHERLHLC